MEESVPWREGGGQFVVYNPRSMNILREIEADEDEEAIVNAILADNEALPVVRHVEHGGEGLPEDMSVFEEDAPSEGPPEERSLRRTISRTIASFNPLNVITMAWKEFLMLKSMITNYYLVGEFWELIKSCFQYRKTPGKLFIIFEATLVHAKIPLQQLVRGNSIQQDLGHPLELRVTKDLRKLYQTNMLFAGAIDEIYMKLSEKISVYGYLFPESPEHVLCISTCDKLIMFMEQLGLFSRVLLRKVPQIPEHEEIAAIVNLVGYNWRAYSKEITDRISFSDSSDIQELYFGALEGMFIVSSSLTYFLQWPHNPPGVYHELSKYIMDLTVTINDTQAGLSSMVQIYNHDILPVAKPSIRSTTFARPVNYSREAKVAYHTNEIMRWCAKFSVHSQAVKDKATKLMDVSRLMILAGGDEVKECRGIAEELDGLHHESVKMEEQLSRLITTQNMLLKDVVARLVPPTRMMPPVEREIIESEDEDEPKFKSVGIQVKVRKPRVFESHKTVEEEVVSLPVEEEIPYMASSDMVYVAKWKEDWIPANDGQDDDGLDAPREEKVVKQLYSGVMDQLKDALVSVKTDMDEREKQAVVKTFGVAADEMKEEEKEGNSCNGREEPDGLETAGNKSDEAELGDNETENRGRRAKTRGGATMKRRRRAENGEFETGKGGGDAEIAGAAGAEGISSVIKLHVRQVDTQYDSDNTDDPLLCGMDPIFKEQLKRRMQRFNAGRNITVHETYGNGNSTSGASIETFKTAEGGSQSLASIAPDTVDESIADSKAKGDNKNSGDNEEGNQEGEEEENSA